MSLDRAKLTDLPLYRAESDEIRQMRAGLTIQRDCVGVQASNESTSFARDSDHFIKMYGNLFQALGETCSKMAAKANEVAQL